VTPERQKLVKESWAIVAPHGARVAERFYARLFELDSTARSLFASTDMEAQGQKVMSMLAAVVNAMDDPDWLVRHLSALGHRHVDYGVTHAQYDTVRDALFWGMVEVLGERFDPQTRDAWSEAYALTAALMQRGMSSGGQARPRGGPD
jgi:hemoglobin-like flavoprotein